MSTETKYYCDFKGCGKSMKDSEKTHSLQLNTDRGQFEPIGDWDICPEHAKYIFELFEKESK